MNVVRNCVVLLYNLTDWMKNKNCPHYFVNNCNLIDASLHVEIIATQLVSITEPWLSTWFVNNYIRQCTQLCPDRVSRLFDDVSTSMKLQNAVSAAVDWRLNSVLYDLFAVCSSAEFFVARSVWGFPLTAELSAYWMNELAKIDFCLCDYFNAIAFQYIASRIAQNRFNEELLDVLATLVGQFVGKRRYRNQLSSVLSMSQAAKVMKVVANNSRNTVQLIEIELSKAYLYRALRRKDSDSDSIYCLTNVYLAILHYVTGQYHMAIDHCTLVTRSQDHPQCSLHVVQGELLPKIDNDIDTVLGLSVFYQYVRTAALNQQQTQHVSVFTTELFAHYLHVRCLSVMKCRPLTQTSSVDAVQRYQRHLFGSKEIFATDVLLLTFLSRIKCLTNDKRQSSDSRQTPTTPRISHSLDTSELVEILQQSAVEHLTVFRQLEAQLFSSVGVIVTTDFEELYAYKRGEYQRCLQLSTHNVHTLIGVESVLCVLTYPEFVQLMDDDIASLIGLTLIVNTSRRDDLIYYYCHVTVHQLYLSLYLMTQCQLKLHHSASSLAQTLDYVEVARRHLDERYTFDHLLLKLIERKILLCIRRELV